MGLKSDRWIRQMAREAHMIQPFAEGDLEELGWRHLARKRLARAWEGEEDALYDYL